MRELGVVAPPKKEAEGLARGAKIVIRTPRGQEYATVLCEATKDRTSRSRGAAFSEFAFVRRATRADAANAAKIKSLESSDFDRCLKIISKLKLQMTLVKVERILGGERIVAYYVADGRVDFRELVRALAAEFQTRIEMKQIGVRDETKLLADVGDCGREICCKAYLATMPPVSMKMAKLQKATLDPTKVSGRCGRLKCCLRYEYDVYNELLDETPAIGRIVETPKGQGRVVAQELLARRVVVEMEDGVRQTYDVAELVAASPKRKETRRPRATRKDDRRDK